MSTVRMDIWGGEGSCDHVARIHYDISDPAWRDVSQTEMAAGFLVNLRSIGPGEGWGPNEDFDKRRHIAAGRA